MFYFLLNVALLKLIDVVPSISLKMLPLQTPFNEKAGALAPIGKVGCSSAKEIFFPNTISNRAVIKIRMELFYEKINKISDHN